LDGYCRRGIDGRLGCIGFFLLGLGGALHQRKQKKDGYIFHAVIFKRRKKNTTKTAMKQFSLLNIRIYELFYTKKQKY
jgi:hypothetical protein